MAVNSHPCFVSGRFVERRMRPRISHNPHQDPRRRVYIKSQPCSASPHLAVGAQLALSARAGAQLRRTRRPMGRIEYGALGGRGMSIRIASSATLDSKQTDQCTFSQDTAESNKIINQHAA